MCQSNWLAHTRGATTDPLIRSKEDWDALLRWSLWWEGDPLCPSYEQEHYSGWAIDVSVSPLFGPIAIGRALSEVWALCANHQESPNHLKATDQNWHWDTDRWVPDMDNKVEGRAQTST